MASPSSMLFMRTDLLHLVSVLPPAGLLNIATRRRDFFLIPNQTFMQVLKSIKYLANNFSSAAEVIFTH